MTVHISTEDGKLAACYDKLWHILIERHMSKTQLIRKAKISTNAMAHLSKNEDVCIDLLTRICSALECRIEDIMEVVPDSQG